MTDDEKLQYDLAIHAATAKTIVDCQRDNQAILKNRFLINFRAIYKDYSDEHYQNTLKEIKAMLDNSK